MALIKITVLNVPAQCVGYLDVALTVQTKKGDIVGTPNPHNSITFEVEFTFRNGKPSGPTINSQGDGRKFIYLRWTGIENGRRAQFKRIKLYLNQLPNLSEEIEQYSIVIEGLDSKGQPACSTAKIIAIN